jgi:hypothetical protein
VQPFPLSRLAPVDPPVVDLRAVARGRAATTADQDAESAGKQHGRETHRPRASKLMENRGKEKPGWVPPEADERQAGPTQ